MKKLLLLGLAIFSITVKAQELHSVAQIADVLSQGKPVHFYVDLAQCKSEFGSSKASIFLTPNAVMAVGANRITASDQHFTLDNPDYPGMPVYDYSKFNINADGDTHINITVLKAVTYERLKNYKIDCELDKGFKVFDSL